MRETLAFPFYISAKLFAWLASQIDDEPVICFSLRESEEVDLDDDDFQFPGV